ncbi:MAG: hypothetical protein U0T60_01045 [Buchnera aphidicola (Meitanaphis microgallis)]
MYNNNQELSFWKRHSSISQFNDYKSTISKHISKNLEKIVLSTLSIGKNI